MQLDQWAFVGVLLVIAVLLPAVPIAIGFILGPRKPNAIKNDTYECGLETIGDTWVQFRVQFYIYALIFLIFDVEIVLLFPWAVAYNQQGSRPELLAFLAVLVFLLPLAVDVIYSWRKGTLEWM